MSSKTSQLSGSRSFSKKPECRGTGGATVACRRLLDKIQWYRRSSRLSLLQRGWVFVDWICLNEAYGTGNNQRVCTFETSSNFFQHQAKKYQ